MDTSKREETKAAVAAFLAKHAGPGNHPSGSPQSVHGSGGSALPSGPVTRFHAMGEDGLVSSSHTTWGDAYSALQDLTGERRPNKSRVVRTGSSEHTQSDQALAVLHHAPKPK